MDVERHVLGLAAHAGEPAAFPGGLAVAIEFGGILPEGGGEDLHGAVIPEVEIEGVGPAAAKAADAVDLSLDALPRSCGVLDVRHGRKCNGRRGCGKTGGGSGGGGAAAVEGVGDVAKAEEGADHLGAGRSGKGAGVFEETADAAGGIFGVEAGGANDAEAGGTDDPAGGIAAGEGEGDVIDAVGAAHFAHGLADPGKDGINEGFGGGAIGRGGELPAGLADAHAVADEALNAAVG